MRINGSLAIAAGLASLPFLSPLAHASSASAGADFLNIPVGAQAAALGSAYTALADNAYAPVWNPAGLGVIDATGIAAEHLDYLDSIHYEHISAVVPLPESRGSDTHRGLGISAQYLGSGSMNRTDIDASGNLVNTNSSFSSRYGAYNISYGQSFGDRLSLGVTGKWINAQLDDVSADAFGADLGAMYRVSDKLRLAATMTNAGSHLKFLDDADPLPLAFHAAAAFTPTHQTMVAVEGVFPKEGVGSAHLGAQWRPIEYLSLRVGYQTQTAQELGGFSGFSAGVGLDVMGQEFAYAWTPYGDLGNAQYFSLLLKFGNRTEEKRNLIGYGTVKSHRTAKTIERSDGDYQQLMQLLTEDDGQRVAQGNAVSQEAAQ